MIPLNGQGTAVSLCKTCLLLACVFLFSRCKKPQDLFVPDGFEVTVVADSIPGGARHIAVSENGDLYVKLLQTKKGGNAALRDTDGDGKMDSIATFGGYPEVGRYGTSMRIYQGYLYFSTELVVYRMKLSPGSLVPEGEPEVILTDDHPHRSHEHIAKPVTFDDQGHIYIPFGAPSNACQEFNRTPFSVGMDPCGMLEDHGGVWRFDAHKTNQTQKDGYKYATGLRSLVGIEWNPLDKKLYAVMHGRDDLLRLWPNLFSPWQSAVLPAEEFLRIEEGSHAGWPYCYYDQMQGKKVLAPEYGGDGKIVGRCDSFYNPIVGFPGHWAPNDLFFYNGDQYPEHYKNGAFIAFHGSTNRAPYPQAGYFIGFMPYRDGEFKGPVEVFADGFARLDTIVNVSDAVYRPMGIAMGPDGSLYFAETEKGRVWKVSYKGNKEKFGPAQLASMAQRALTANHIRTPDEVLDNLDRGKKADGEKAYRVYCGACHQNNGLGASGRFPPLASDWVSGDKNRLINVVLQGLEGDILVNNEIWNGTMPRHDFLKDEDIATILTYIRSSFGNQADAVTPEEVKAQRDQLLEKK
ncbi:MAG TPA: PQQ-dependent sugar dehydrogenase [Saprospiraceae bacterium]|nr:PQQ-dependent sugar dehydrogenase [Saprospiraceae bacterium]